MKWEFKTFWIESLYRVDYSKGALFFKPSKRPNPRAKGLSLTRRFILGVIFIVGHFAGCETVKSVDPSIISEYKGFLQVGLTTKQEAQDRLGPCHAVYDQGRILIYHVYFEKEGRMNLQGRGICYACVLVFDKNNVLEQHSLVKNGCR